MQILLLRAENRAIFRHKTLLSRSEVVHRLDEISEVIVQTQRNRKGHRLSRLAAVIPDGQSAGTHPLTLAYTNFYNHSAAARAINAWLDSTRPHA